MTKKILCLILTVAMLSTFFVIGANASIATAGTYADESFTRPEDQIGNAEWKPDDWSITGRHGTAALLDQGIYRVSEEGYVELCRAGYDVGACISRVFSLPAEFTLMFDVMFPETSGFTGALMVSSSLNGYEQSVNVNGAITYFNETTNMNGSVGAGGHAAGKWYTYVYQVSGDRMSVYRKAEDESIFSLKADNVKMATRAGNEFYAYSTSPTAFICIDNVKVFAGTYMTDAEVTVEPVFIQTHKFKVSKEDGTVTEIALDEAEDSEHYEYYTEDEYEYKFKGTFDVTSASTSPLDSGSVTPIMTIYDQKGKVIDMVFGDREINYNNSNTFELETDQYTQAEYDEMKGYTAELYLWNSFSALSPQSSAFTTTIQ